MVVCVWGSGAKEVFLGKIFHPDKKINDLKKEPYPFGFWILLYERVMLIPTLVYAALKGRSKKLQKSHSRLLIALNCCSRLHQPYVRLQNPGFLNDF